MDTVDKFAVSIVFLNNISVGDYMVKFSNKVKIITAVLLIVSVLVSIAFVMVCRQKLDWQKRTGEYNISNWYHLETMARNIDYQGYTIENLKTYYDNLNTVIYTCSHPLMPPLNGNGKAHSFMGGYYVGLAQTLISDSLDEDKRKEGLLIFEAMNKEFLSLCDELTGKVNNNSDKKAELVNTDTDLYVSMEKRAIAFCDKYARQISQYNYSVGVSSYVIKNIDKEFKGDDISVFVQYVADYYSKTRVDCRIKTENKNPLIHINSKIKGINDEYSYIEGTGYTKGSETQYTLYFDSIGNERNVELFIELKSGEKITIPLKLE